MCERHCGTDLSCETISIPQIDWMSLVHIYTWYLSEPVLYHFICVNFITIYNPLSDQLAGYKYIIKCINGMNSLKT